MLISQQRIQNTQTAIDFKNRQTVRVEKHKHLGLLMQKDLSWATHIDSVAEKSFKLVNIMRYYHYTLDRSTLETIYIPVICPLMEFGQVVWACLRVLNWVVETSWEPLQKRRENKKLITMYKSIHNEHDIAPSYL